jgi:glutamyl-tRNA synthetase
MKIFYEDFDSFDTEKANKIFSEESLNLLSDLMSLLEGIDEWTKEKIHLCIEQICQKNSIGFGKIGQPFRLALTGHGNAGSIDSLAELIGKEKSLNRLGKAIQYQK